MSVVVRILMLLLIGWGVTVGAADGAAAAPRYTYDARAINVPSRSTEPRRVPAPGQLGGWNYRRYQPVSSQWVRSLLAAEGADAAATTGLRDAAESCANSFTAGTPVLMADGKEEPIAEVKVGDKVLATDPESGRTEARPVTALIRHSGKHTLVDITLDDGSKITTTDHHPFWDASTRTFTDAINLHVGDKALSDGGRTLTISAERAYDRTLTAYNLQIDGIHTYYAGTTPVLVHNSCSGVPNFEDPAASPGEGWEWRGPSDKGSWYNPKTGESLHPDLAHPDPIGPHYDYRAPDGTFYRMYSDGRMEPK